MKMRSYINIRRGCKKLLFAALWLIVISPLSLKAQNIKVAIAANLQPVMKALLKDFKAKTGISVDAISGPSGGLTTQIKNGAPFDVFLSADVNFPDELFKSGFATNKPVVYASGTLIICSTEKLDLSNWPKLLPGGSVQKIAIGNPAIAPYGKAAQEALTKAGIYERMQPKIVLGESITQVNTYITTGVVQAGFTTLSLVKDAANKTQLYYKIIDPKTYSPIEQGMVLIKQPKPKADAEKFYKYILSPAAKKIFTRYGYHLN
ncbi:molybdate ABC transporter substrate-binding protein [Mucilaginibacter gilvus]|nr:molybdate ABC transporter substrate-binding protein [Mucilaginibacter gilvus]